MSRQRVLRSGLRARLREEWKVEVDDYVTALAWSADASRLAVALGSGPIAVLDAADGSACQRHEGHGMGTLALAWRPEGDELASAGQDGLARIWRDGERAVEVAGGASWVERLSWSPDGSRLATSAGRCLRIWDTAGNLQHDLASPEIIYDIGWRPSGRGIAAAGYGGVRIWRWDRLDKPRHLQWKGASLRLAWSPDGDYIATGDQDASVHFWMTASGHDLMASGYDTKVRHLSWDSSSRFLATAGGSDVLVWDCSGKGPAGTRPRSAEVHEAGVGALAFQHQGRWLASGDGQGRLVAWDPRIGPKTVGGASVGGPVTQLAWSPDDRRCAVATSTGEVVVFEFSQE
ncbi:MAG TPA: WD40 repeat domain-containing protein [Candidatus Dormibacteraeota bacterium]